MTVETSILRSVKKVLGVDPDYDVFDQDIIMHINSIFSVLHQIGASPHQNFMISGPEETWEDFLQGRHNAQMVKTYIFLRVRLLFDPPTTSFAIKALEDQYKELEWRLNVMEDVFASEPPPPLIPEGYAYLIAPIEEGG